MPIWNPADADVELCLDPTDATTVTIDTGISVLADKSGKGRNLTQPTPALQPPINAAAINSLDVIGFASGQYLSGPPVAKSVSIFYVQRTSDTSYIAMSSGAGSSYYGLCAVAGSGSTQIFGGIGTPVIMVNGVVVNPVNRGEVYTALGAGVVVVELIGADLTAWSSIDLAFYGYGYEFSGDFGDLVIVDQALMTTELQDKIRGALAWKYGVESSLPVSDPYRYAPPLATVNLSVELSQIYSITWETWLNQYYGDVPILEKSLIQSYRGASVIEKSLLQKWGSALEMEISLTQPWAMPETLEPFNEQNYGIAAAVLQVTSEQLYHIHANTELFADLVQPYAMAAEAAALYIFDTKIFVDGERIPYVTCDWQATKSEYAWHVDFAVKSLEVAIKCANGAEIVIVSAGDSYRFRCYDGWKLDKRYLETTYRIEAWSPTRELDLAAPLAGDLSGMASAIVADLAAPHGITVDWQMADGYIAAGKLTANSETPLAVIRKLVEDGDRGRIQTAADGVTLLCVCGTETPVPDWPTVIPAQVIDARVERRSTTWQNDIQPGYNEFYVSDQLAAGQSEQLIDTMIDSRTSDVRLYVTPLADAPGYTLEHSGGVSVSIEPMGIVSEVVEDELVSIEGGIGKTRLPIYGVVERSWKELPLGDIVTSEDGIIQAAVAGYSLLRLSYTTRFYQWFARDSRIEDVLFVARRAD